MISRRHLSLLALLLLLAPGSTVAQALPDSLAGAATGRLQLRVELAGAGRVDLPNGVEWAGLGVARTLDVSLAMVDIGNPGFAIVAPPTSQELPADVADLEAKLAACGEDRGCLSSTMMAFSQSGGGNPFAAMVGMSEPRYRNWMPDRRGDCVSGSVEAHDVGEGVNIAPPEPARAYRFTRDGSLSLAGGDQAMLDSLCSAELTVDSTAGEAHLRLPGLGFGVPVALAGDVFTDERTVPFLHVDGRLELFGQPAGEGDTAGGRAVIEAAGTVSHNSGQIAVPVQARIEWSFTPG